MILAPLGMIILKETNNMSDYTLNGVLISCIRGFERDAASEAWWMLSSIMKTESIDIDPTDVPGLVYASFE